MNTKITNKISTFVLAFLALIIFGATNIKAAPGDLDPTFGSGGKVITSGNNINYVNVAQGMAIQSDGKIVVVGDGTINGPNWDFAVVRYNTDGSLDSSFGGTGRVITPVSINYDGAFSVAIQADGKIVVAGYCDIGGGSRFAVVRYNPNGSLDTSFNGTGIVITSVASSQDYANSVAIQADGKIVVAGRSSNLFALVRYNTNGSLDTTFNGTGKVITLALGGVSSVAIQADGKIVAAGGSNLVRYNPSGSLDTSFGGTGIVTLVEIGTNSIAIQADGKIVAAGSGGGFAVARYNGDGSLDTSFGGTGKIVIPVGNSDSEAYSAAIQSDGKIVAVGYSGNFNVGTDFAVVRLNPNGSLDTTFNGTGKVITPISSQDFISYAVAVAIQSDGKIVAAGNTDSGIYDYYDFAVVRYQGGSNANIRTRFDFDGDGRADVSVFRPSDGIWYLNQSTNGFSASPFGLSTDKITPADFDGDGKTDVAVFRDGIWYWLNSSNGSFQGAQFGQAGDIPVPADYMGDGRAELAVYRSGIWFTLNLANNQFQAVRFGNATDKPVPGDYDGDGLGDYAVYRNGTWHLLQSTQGSSAIQFGISTDKLVPADYDGDGKTDVAVYRDGIWYLQRSQAGLTAFQFGFASDIPAPADYDGDGKADIAVFRDGIWYLQRSAAGFTGISFGASTDKPVPAAYMP